MKIWEIRILSVRNSPQTLFSRKLDCLIRRRLLHMIDHHHTHKSLCRLQLQPQLLLHRSEDVRGSVRVVSRRSTRGHTSGLRFRSIRPPIPALVLGALNLSRKPSDGAGTFTKASWKPAELNRINRRSFSASHFDFTKP